MTDVKDASEAELLAALARLRDPRCRCGARRLEVVEKIDGFHQRRGCATCNRWDGPPRLDGTPTIPKVPR